MLRYLTCPLLALLFAVVFVSTALAADDKPAAPFGIKPPELKETKTVVKLREEFTDVRIGGGGRYLIFNMPKVKKLAIFDVTEGDIKKEILVAEDDITFAAGLESLFIGLKKANKVERWSLKNFELEKTTPIPPKTDIKTMYMGYATKGPLLANGMFVDPVNLRALPVNTKADGWDAGGNLVASADGTVYTRWGANSVAFVVEGLDVKRYEEPKLGHVLLSADGKEAYTSHGVVSRNLKRAAAADAEYGFCVPAIHFSNFFLSIKMEENGKGGFTLYHRGLRKPITTLEAAHGLFLDSAGVDTYGVWNRVFFVPGANMIVVVPQTKDQIVLYKFDPDEALDKADFPYLLVVSEPINLAKAGKAYSYPIKVKAKNKDNLTYKLDAGPKDMAVSAEGVVTWTPPAKAVGSSGEVRITISDGKGQETLHTFMLGVVK